MIMNRSAKLRTGFEQIYALNATFQGSSLASSHCLGSFEPALSAARRIIPTSPPPAYNAWGDSFGSLRTQCYGYGPDQSFLHHPLKRGLYLPEHFFARVEQNDDFHIGIRGPLQRRRQKASVGARPKLPALFFAAHFLFWGNQSLPPHGS